MRKQAPALVFRTDMIGAVSVLGDDRRGARATLPSDSADIRLRFAAQSSDAPRRSSVLLDEVEALYCAGPAGGAGVRRRADAAPHQHVMPDRAQVRARRA